MDVDLLRPGTVPISPDTVLWFEFLLDPTLLLKHLQKPKSDPTPTDLIIKFYTAIYDSIKNDIRRAEIEQGENAIENINDFKPKDTLKNLALKLLSLKVTAFIKWNLEELQNKLPVKFQICLIQDLLYFTNEKIKVDIPNVPECSVTGVTDQYLFALVLYHRWLITSVVQRDINLKIVKPTGSLNLGMIDEFFICTQDTIMSSVNFLSEVLAQKRTPKLLTFDTFRMLNEDSVDIDQHWEKAIEISSQEFEAQLHYDLGYFYFHRENYELAKQHFLNCSECYYNIDPEKIQYVSFDVKFLNGFLCACNVPVEGFRPTLLQQMNTSIANQYTGILSILQEDNKHREIPLMYRVILELDIQGALSSGKFTVARDLLIKVQMLNVVRHVIDDAAILTGDFIHRLKYGGEKSIDILFWAFSSVLDGNADAAEKESIRNFFVKLLMSEDISQLFDKLMEEESLKCLFLHDDFEKISGSTIKIDDVQIPESLKTLNWHTPDFSTRRNPFLEERILEQKLISCFSYTKIKEILQKLSHLNPSKQLWRINDNWELAIPLQSVVVCLSGFFQDYSYVLLAKSRQLMLMNDFKGSLDLLNVLEMEAKNHTTNPNAGNKLCRLVNWEALLVNITQLFAEWPADEIDKKELMAKCQSCLSALETGDTVIPRLEVIEQCALCLLNLGEWEYLCGLEKRWNYFEMATAIAYACQDLVKYKGNKKVSRDMWDIVLPIFGPNASQTKRSSSGSTTVMHRDSPTNNTKKNLILFLSRLRDITTLSVVISMLARLYNVLRDESNLELNVDYIVLWPAVVSNTNAYNSKGVCEILSQLVLQGLKYYPNNVSWLRLMGDINFGNNNYETAMKYYLESLIIATDYFNLPVCKPTVDDFIFKRMIKCCIQINCNTQAAILCQFLDEVDYTLAFKCLGDSKSANCNDAMDAYYNCIWDTAILEYLVHLHNKRGEHNKKQQALKAIGVLELNSNNNEEIQRESTNVRKSKFLRAMSKQYLSRTF